MQDIGRIIMILGAAAILLGMVFYFGWAPGLFGWMGRLPGDIRVEREGSGFYFPITTCIVLSILLTIIVRLAMWIRQS
jgi:hypothetical protein